VLRRVVRRAVLAARRLGVDASVTPTLVGAATEVLGRAYPALIENNDVILSVLEREEAGFDRTLRAGLGAWKKRSPPVRRCSEATWRSRCTTPTASPSN